MQQGLVSVLNLLYGVLVVVRRNRDVAAVNKLQSRQERVHCQWHVVAAVESQTTRTSTDTRRSEPGAGAVRGTGVLHENPKRLASTSKYEKPRVTYEGCANESNVKRRLPVLAQALHPWELGEGRNAGEDRVGRDYMNGISGYPGDNL